ncbi:MAG TPA: hypothetical protein VFI25_11630 [Planctomycetota bacterium]|jgi:hypothetical protein|nr:hypothetical protein [Planctomycetota bacterium]
MGGDARAARSPVVGEGSSTEGRGKTPPPEGGGKTPRGPTWNGGAWPLLPWLAALASLGLYLRTLAPRLDFVDCGERATSAARLGIPPPTGYPLSALLLARNRGQTRSSSGTKVARPHSSAFL